MDAKTYDECISLFAKGFDEVLEICRNESHPAHDKAVEALTLGALTGKGREILFSLAKEYLRKNKLLIN